MKNFLFAFVVILATVAGGAATYYYHSHACGQYFFINSDYACGAKHVISKAGYVTLKNDIINFVENEVAAGDISDAAIYFRDMRAGPTFGINEGVPFIPASLLKLPTVLAILSYEEESPGLLSQKVTYSPEKVSYVTELEQIEIPDSPLKLGESYTIEELLRNTLVYSDNLAFYLSVDHFIRMVPDGSARMMRTYHELGILDPRNPTEESITVRNYSGLFRQLYNVSFLRPEHSEKILNWLGESVYDKGLEGGVPAGVGVAHKFGERDVGENVRQLHDCGIVYFPENPYLLCVMTKGQNWQSMAEFVRTVSEMVYKEVDSRRL